jgi:hypothetical protein
MQTIVSFFFLFSVVSAQVLVGPKVVTRRINSTAVLVGVVVGPETAQTGDIIQYRVLINNVDSTASVVDIRESMCCQDISGACQTWLGHVTQVVCHGVRVAVDYRVTVVARGAATDMQGKTTQVLMPVRINAGHMEGVDNHEIVADSAAWNKFRTAALASLVQKEVASLKKAKPTKTSQKLQLQTLKESRPTIPPSVVIGICSGVALAMAAIVFLWWRYGANAASTASEKETPADAFLNGVQYVPL